MLVSDVSSGCLIWCCVGLMLWFTVLWADPTSVFYLGQILVGLVFAVSFGTGSNAAELD